MAYVVYHQKSLDELDAKLAEAQELSQKLRATMMERSPPMLYLNSFATAEWALELVIDNLEKCRGQVKQGDKRLAKLHATGRAIHRKSQKKAAAKVKKPREAK